MKLNITWYTRQWPHNHRKKECKATLHRKWAASLMNTGCRKIIKSGISVFNCLIQLHNTEDANHYAILIYLAPSKFKSKEK